MVKNIDVIKMKYINKYESLLYSLMNIHIYCIKQEYYRINTCVWIFNIRDQKKLLMEDKRILLIENKTIWTKEYYYQKISILEDLIFNNTRLDIIIDLCISEINKFK